MSTANQFTTRIKRSPYSAVSTVSKATVAGVMSPTWNLTQKVVWIDNRLQASRKLLLNWKFFKTFRLAAMRTHSFLPLQWIMTTRGRQELLNLNTWQPNHSIISATTYKYQSSRMMSLRLKAPKSMTCTKKIKNRVNDWTQRIRLQSKEKRRMWILTRPTQR